MMRREERAKQFMPFDALKGLKEALEDRLERHTRVQKEEVLEDKAQEISETISKLERGMEISVTYYKAFHYRTIEGQAVKIDKVYKYLQIGEERVFFNDIYEINFI